MSDFSARIFVLLQYLSPKHLLTAIVCRIARIRNVAIKNFLISKFVGLYGVDIEEVRYQVPDGYPTFNDFFVRELVDNAREVDSATDSIISPVDGAVSAAGRIEGSSVFQAKGIRYTLDELLATNLADTDYYSNGSFATLYLAPYNYHRVHAPVDAEIVAARYVPGSLFSVNDKTVRHLTGLFARNERLICHFSSAHGPLVLIFVGALNVGTINTRWTGDLRPQKRGVVEEINIHDHDVSLQVSKGDTLGWFNMGSTVILLLPPNVSDDFAELRPNNKVRMGQSIGRFVGLE